MKKLDPGVKCSGRARHTVQFKYNKLGLKKDIKIRICEYHRQILEGDGVISKDGIYDIKGKLGLGNFSCILITDKI